MKKVYSFIATLHILFCTSQTMYQIEYNFTDIHQNILKSTLLTNNSEAVYKIYDDRENGVVGHEETAYIVYNDSINKVFYANLETAYFRFPVYDREFSYLDEYKSKMKWIVNSENKKKIGKYDCIEANIWLNSRGYTVWFTLDVPIKFGPLKLHQLPGLIVQVIEDKGLFRIDLKSIAKATTNKEFNHYKNYLLKQKKILTYKEFEKAALDLEVGSQISYFADLKQDDLKTGNRTSVDNKRLDAETEDFYIEFPPSLLHELSKVNL